MSIVDVAAPAGTGGWCPDIPVGDDIGRLGYHVASGPREDDTVTVHNLVLHRSVTLGSAWVESVDIKRASLWRVLALAEASLLKSLSNTRGSE
jgi:hypothetical protein